MPTPDIVIGTPDALSRILAARVVMACRDAVEERGMVHVALTGGTAFRTLAGSLTTAAIAWDRVHLYWGDERAMPADHPDSNYRLACDVLLDRIAIPAPRVHRMPADADDLDAAASRYEAVLTKGLGADGRFDIVMLGVGPDGHVCSLFPDHALLGERGRRVAAVYDSPKPPPRRLTLTLPVLEAARLVIVLALGQDKSAPVGAAVQESASTLPIARVVQSAASVLCLLDTPAAALLSSDLG